MPCRTSLHEPVVSLITLPLFHSFGQVCQMNAVSTAATRSCCCRASTPARVLDHAAERVNLWCGVPTMYWALMQYLRRDEQVDVRRARRHLRLCVSGGAPMPVELLRASSRRPSACAILEGYGLSETSPVATFNHVERPSQAGTVGQPLFGVEVACVDDARTSRCRPASAARWSSAATTS